MAEAIRQTSIEKQKEHTANMEKVLSSDLVFWAITLLNLGLMALDFHSHPHQGLADLERRKALAEAIGVLAKHIGNFGYSSTLAMGATMTYHTLNLISSNEQYRRLTKRGLKFVLASIVTLNLVIESFDAETIEAITTSNGEFGGDVSAGLLGTLSGFAQIQIMALRIKRQKAAKKRKEEVSAL